MEPETPTKFDLRQTESKVFFAICDCSLDKKYSFWKLSREQAEKFIKKTKVYRKTNMGTMDFSSSRKWADSRKTWN